MPGSIFQLLRHSLTTLSSVACDLVRLLVLVSRSRRALAAENLFLRKQLALFQERKMKPHRAYDSTRLIMAATSASRLTRHAQAFEESGVTRSNDFYWSHPRLADSSPAICRCGFLRSLSGALAARSLELSRRGRSLG
jgi:hypothetical protein